MSRLLFPFVSIVGQRNIKRALILNIINPKIGGVLLSGEKGTAKSTTVRAISEITDNMKVVEIPVGVTEDRLVGSVDFVKSVKRGKHEATPGLLAEADGHILYIDEVNLLSEYNMNTILQVAGNERNIVEREGFSTSYQTSFILVGSMNPEEGKLKSHFLDRFGLYVSAEGEKNLPSRIEILENVIAFEKDPVKYRCSYDADTKRLKNKIEKARKKLIQVSISKNAMKLASQMALEANVEGHRADKVIIETARAIAAYDGRTVINVDDISEAASFALPHRMRQSDNVKQSCQSELDQQKKDNESSNEIDENSNEKDERGNTADRDARENTSKKDDTLSEQDNSVNNDNNTQDISGRNNHYKEENDCASDKNDDNIEKASEPYRIKSWQTTNNRKKVNIGTGKRDTVVSTNRQGRYVRYRLPSNNDISDIAVDATLRAAAPYQKFRSNGKTLISIKKQDIRIKVREKRTGGCILFVVDASASMGANRRMKEVKAAILSLLHVSYQKRDRVGLIAFRKESAEVLLNITNSVEMAQKELQYLPTGGKTPLAAGLDLAYDVVRSLKIKEPEIQPTIVLVSDGRASGKKNGNKSPFDQALESAKKIARENVDTIIIDTENDFIKFHLCDKLNEILQGVLVSIERLKAEGIVDTVNTFVSR